ncbi:hypothetical protein [Streptomyces sp. N2A]|uniref:hypothetical protein n=1 Tax=Streptomyces sp. N2A TaxID=3073936 RepID=UPI00286FB179|nr:hypothetical protein [Streptomyces sp. N2A]
MSNTNTNTNAREDGTPNANTARITYVRIAEVLIDLGMINREKGESVLADAVGYATEPITHRYDIASALESFGVAVSIHSDDVDFADAHYEWLLNEAAALAGGQVTIANYRFEKVNPGDEECGLGTMHFECNSKPLSFSIEQESNDYLDMGAAQAAIEALSPDGDPREFRCVVQEGGQLSDDIMVLATAEQREGLRQHLGITFQRPC